MFGYIWLSLVTWKADPKLKPFTGVGVVTKSKNESL